MFFHKEKPTRGKHPYILTWKNSTAVWQRKGGKGEGRKGEGRKGGRKEGRKEERKKGGSTKKKGSNNIQNDDDYPKIAARL